ncbi:hypothetical protein L1049_028483 [Liquidambar formosana]|uniref:DUF4283 domain-containing protein n=1 Tax=Liquidambar formosana TaxID=63359 RepID=A0AAP0WTH7_LIQFO
MDLPVDNISQLISQTATLCCDKDSLELAPDPESVVNASHLFLVGKLVTDKVVNIQAIKAVMSRAWFLKQGVSTSCLAPNTFLFGFSNCNDRNGALNTGPWSISGFYLVLKVWPPSLVLDEIIFTLSSFWVQVHGLPPNRRSHDNLLKIGAIIGKLIVSDSSTFGPLMWRKFVRFKVEFNI